MLSPWLYTSINLCAMVANAMVIAVSTRLSHNSRVFIANLAFIDFISAVTFIWQRLVVMKDFAPSFVSEVLYAPWELDSTLLNSTLLITPNDTATLRVHDLRSNVCAWTDFAVYSSYFATILAGPLISLDRFIALHYPIWYRASMTVAKALAACVIADIIIPLYLLVTLVCVILNFILQLEVQRASQMHSNWPTKSLWVLSDPQCGITSSNNSAVTVYGFFTAMSVVFLLQFVAFGTAMFWNYRIYVKINSLAETKNRWRTQNTEPPADGQTETAKPLLPDNKTAGQVPRSTSNRSNEDRAVLNLCVVQAIVPWLLQAPDVAMIILDMFVQLDNQYPMLVPVREVTLVANLSCSLVNPVVAVLFVASYRRAIIACGRTKD